MLFFGDGEAEPFHDGEEIDPDEAFEGEVLVVKKVAGVKGGADGDALEFHPCSAEARDGIFLWAQEAFDGGGP